MKKIMVAVALCLLACNAQAESKNQALLSCVYDSVDASIAVPPETLNFVQVAKAECGSEFVAWAHSEGITGDLLPLFKDLTFNIAVRGALENYVRESRDFPRCSYDS